MGNEFYRQSEEGEEFGPCDRDQLLEMIKRGEVGPETPLRSANSTFWVSAQRIKGLFGGTASDSLITEDSSPLVMECVAYESHITALNADPESAMRRSPRTHSAGSWWRSDVGWETVLGLVLIVSAAAWMIWGTSEASRFPPPQRLSSTAASNYFFFNTGPWSLLEIILLWMDAILLIGALLFGRLILAAGRTGD